MGKWGVLAVLAFAQFLMVLDQAVMNVSISQLVHDFDTTVTTTQFVIAFYALVMAALMVTGGKLGDRRDGGAAFVMNPSPVPLTTHPLKASTAAVMIAS